jgi:hypothetical protein
LAINTRQANSAGFKLHSKRESRVRRH